MTQAPTAADWAALAIDPTPDADAVRRAYRARLRVVGPETDPDGFQLLRAAYETVLASVDRAAPAAPPVDTERAAATATAFIDALDARRAAGDEAAAIALVDATQAAHPPGSAAAEAIEDMLFDQVAFSRNVSPGLFLHLVDRFDWRDIGGRAARIDAERHAFLLDRIAAEDWYRALPDGRDDPDRRIETILAGGREQAEAALRASPPTPEERAHVRDLFDQLRTHGMFILVRFDGGTLAALREAVEGPPLLGETVAPAGASVTDLVSPERRRIIRFGVLGVIGVSVAARLLRPSPTVHADTALSADLALPILKNPATPWVDLIPGPDGLKVDWAPVMRMRRAILELHTGYNGEEPTTLFNLPDTDAPIGFIAPPSLESLSMRIRYSDGTWSEVRRYDLRQAAR